MAQRTRSHWITFWLITLACVAVPLATYAVSVYVYRISDMDEDVEIYKALAQNAEHRKQAYMDLADLMDERGYCNHAKTARAAAFADSDYDLEKAQRQIEAWSSDFQYYEGVSIAFGIATTIFGVFAVLVMIGNIGAICNP